MGWSKSGICQREKRCGVSRGMIIWLGPRVGRGIVGFCLVRLIGLWGHLFAWF